MPKDSPIPIQPPTSVPSHSINTESLRGPLEISPSPLHQQLQHQSKSFPPRLQRTPSISSQSSLDSAPSRHSVSVLNHRRLSCFFFNVVRRLTVVHSTFLTTL